MKIEFRDSQTLKGGIALTDIAIEKDKVYDLPDAQAKYALETFPNNVFKVTEKTEKKIIKPPKKEVVDEDANKAITDSADKPTKKFGKK